MKYGEKDTFLQTIDFNQNTIVALLKGPDIQYRNLLINEQERSKVPLINMQSRDKDSFLQIHVRSLNSKEQERLLQNASANHLCLTLPIQYPCSIRPRIKSKYFRRRSSFKQKFNRHYPNNVNRLKSAVNISFINDKSSDKSIQKISRESHSKLFINLPKKNTSKLNNRSFNACTHQNLCQICGSILSNEICKCIVQRLLKLNKKKHISEA